MAVKTCHIYRKRYVWSKKNMVICIIISVNMWVINIDIALDLYL